MQLDASKLRQRITPLFEENFQKFGELGAAVSIWQNGKAIVDLEVQGDLERVLFDERAILRRLDEIAAQISNDYRDRELTVIAVLNGSLVKLARKTSRSLSCFRTRPASPLWIEKLTCSIMRASFPRSKNKNRFGRRELHTVITRALSATFSMSSSGESPVNRYANTGEKHLPGRLTSIFGSACRKKRIRVSPQCMRPKPVTCRSQNNFTSILFRLELWHEKPLPRRMDCTRSAR